MCLLQPPLWWQAARGPSLPSPANGSRRPVVTGRLCAERHHFFPFIPAVASWPSSPYPSCLSESRWTAEGQSPWAWFFLGEQRAITTRLSGSSNMAPALRHMGWLAGLCVLSVWVYMCVLGECDASPNANACCFKKWEPLSPLLSFLFGKVYYGLLVLAVIFFPLQKEEQPERCTCHPFWKLLICSWGKKKFLKFCIFLQGAFLIYVWKCALFVHANLVCTETHTHVIHHLQNPSMPSPSAPL